MSQKKLVQIVTLDINDVLAVNKTRFTDESKDFRKRSMKIALYREADLYIYQIKLIK